VRSRRRYDEASFDRCGEGREMERRTVAWRADRTYSSSEPQPLRVRCEKAVAGES